MHDAAPVYRVPDDAAANNEAMGTKPKFWFARDGEMWLFKVSRPGSGEHWAEVLAAGLAELLGLPHAHYELAHWRNECGVVTPRFTSNGFDLVHGNELLTEQDPAYPREGARHIRTQQHTIDAVRAVIGDARVRLPRGWTAPAGVATAASAFGGYLLLDAWIGNTDRHHENWGFLVRGDERHLAPTFDHASSLGAHETATTRQRRLTTRDRGYGIEAYVRRSGARSALYRGVTDARPLGLIEAFTAWDRHVPCDAWRERLASIDTEAIAAVVGQLPAPEGSGPSLAFAQAILSANRRRLLEGP